jgi:DNA transformation protein
MGSDLVDHCLELLAPLGDVRARRMFGGHGLYCDELFFGLIAAEQLYLKVDEQSRAAFEAEGCQPFVYDARGQAVTMGYRSVPPQAMDSAVQMLPWARLALAAALRASAAKAVRSSAKPRKTAAKRSRARSAPARSRP